MTNRFENLCVLAVASLAVGGTATTNVLLSRIDAARAEASTARAEVADLRGHSHPAPPVADFTAELELCRVRTQHLRSTMEVLILAGTRWPMFVKLPEGPHTGWA